MYAGGLGVGGGRWNASEAGYRRQCRVCFIGILVCFACFLTRVDTLDRTHITAFCGSKFGAQAYLCFIFCFVFFFLLK